MSAPLPHFVKVEDLPDFLKAYKLRAAKFAWQSGHFAMGVVDKAPEGQETQKAKGETDLN